MRAGMRGLTALAAALAATTLGVPVARAGTYDVVSCNAPGAGGVNNSWSWGVEAFGSSVSGDDPDHFAVTGSCSSPTGLRGGSNPSASASRWGLIGRFKFVAPAGTDVRRVTLWRYTTATQSTDNPGTPANESGSWELAARFCTSPLLTDSRLPGAGFYANPCHTGSAGYSSASRVVYDGRAQDFTIGVSCGGATIALQCNTGDASGTPLAFVDFQGATVTLEDTSAPALKVGGPLFAGGWRHGGDLAFYSSSDNSGIRAARLEADGRVLLSNAFACDRTRPIPCRGAVTGGRLAPQGIGDGVHTVRLVTQDAAGNSRMIQRQVLIDDTPPTAVLERAFGKSIVLGVSDATSGVASGTVEVR